MTLFKDNVYEDFGFSLSDGLYEKGIFVNRIRKGGPADTSGANVIKLVYSSLNKLECLSLHSILNYSSLLIKR